MDRASSLEITHPSVDAAIDCYADKLGPVVQARTLTQADGRWPDLRAEVADLFTQHAIGDGRVILPVEHLAIIGQTS